MQHKQPNAWSCLPTAMSYLLNISFVDVINLFGHDGSQIIDDTLPEPSCRRGFHMQEMIDIAMRRGYAVIAIDRIPQIVTDAKRYLQGFPGFQIYGASREEDRWNWHLGEASGILIGEGIKTQHAIAWDHDTQEIFDPQSGLIGKLPLEHFTPESFWRFDIIKSKNK